MTTPIRAKISALGTYVPPRLLTNADLEKMVDTTNDWIMARVGIRERHIVEKGVATSDLAVEAAKKALAQRGLAPSDLDAIIVGTVTPDMFFPSTACLVQHKLGAEGVWGFDLSAACSAFVYAVQTGAQFIATGTHKRVLVIGADVMSSIIDYTDRATCVIFGDGAGAVLLEPAEDDSVGLIDFIHEIDGSGGCFLQMPGGGSLNPATRETVDNKMHYVHQDGQQVFKFAVRKQTEACLKLLERNGLKGSRYRCLHPPPGQPAHHQCHRRAPGPAPGKRNRQYPMLRQHHRRHDSTSHEYRRRTGKTKEGKSSADGVGGRRLHRRCRSPTLGLLGSSAGVPPALSQQV